MKVDLDRCPKCKEGNFAVIESRPPGKNGGHTRRRRRCCSNCNYRETTYEITKSAYEEYLQSKRIVSKLTTTLKEKVTNKRACYKCIQYYQNRCRLDIPELDATECAYYIEEKDD